MLNLPAMPNPKHTSYGNFGGVDFSQDPSLVDSRRSPIGLNMISDNGGNPVKRVGWRVLSTLDAPINGIYYGEVNGVNVLLVHGKSKLYKMTLTNGIWSSTVISSSLADNRSRGFFFKKSGVSNLYLLDGTTYWQYDGSTMQAVSEVATIPTIIISKNPSGTGGTAFEYVNLIQSKRTESFLGDAGSVNYYLSSKSLDATLLVAKIMNSSGGWDTMNENSGFTVNRTTGVVTFSKAKPPIVAGVDNVQITYAKTTEGYADRVNKCTISTTYGIGENNRIFISGNPSYKAYDWFSGIQDPTYFGDLSYSVVGSTENAIMGYSKVGKYLVTIKEQSQSDSTAFLRTGSLVNNKPVFTVESGIVGFGAVSKDCFGNLSDEPLFLSSQGVTALTSTLLSYERTFRNRSFYVDRKLTTETDLQNAVSVVYNGYYFLSINDKMYVMDSRKTSGDKSGNSNYLYECYYWENTPCRVMSVVNQDLFFGTTDGRLCMFNYDLNRTNEDGYDLEAYNDNGVAITAQWSTPNDNDKATQLFKTLTKRGCLVTITPYYRSSGKVYFIVDGDPEKFITQSFMDIFRWDDIDFERFTFNSNESPQEIYFNKKQKRYKRLMIVIRNDSINEPFGIHEIVKTFTYGNYSKNKGGN